MTSPKLSETGILPEQIILDDFLREVVEQTVAHYQRIELLLGIVQNGSLKNATSEQIVTKISFVSQ